MLNIDNVVRLSLELDDVARKYGYEVTETGGQTLVPVIGVDGYLTNRLLLEIRPRAQETQHDQRRMA